MQINTDNRTYSEITELTSEVDFFSSSTKKIEGEEITAQSNSKAALKKLQDDLRRAGYRQQFK